MCKLAAACLTVVLCGCAARHPVAQPSESITAAVATSPPATQEAERVAAAPYEPVVASALVFGLPEEKFGPPLDLSRDGRRPSAFLGFDEGLVEYFAVRVDDRQREDHRFDRYERRAVSVKSGVRYR